MEKDLFKNKTGIGTLKKKIKGTIVLGNYLLLVTPFRHGGNYIFEFPKVFIRPSRISSTSPIKHRARLVTSVRGHLCNRFQEENYPTRLYLPPGMVISVQDMLGKKEITGDLQKSEYLVTSLTERERSTVTSYLINHK
jgi:hypothetical protein